MKKIKYLAIRLALKVVSNVITFVYNPNKERIFQLLWNIYDILSFIIP